MGVALSLLQRIAMGLLCRGQAQAHQDSGWIKTSQARLIKESVDREQVRKETERLVLDA